MMNERRRIMFETLTLTLNETSLKIIFQLLIIISQGHQIPVMKKSPVKSLFINNYADAEYVVECCTSSLETSGLHS